MLITFTIPYKPKKTSLQIITETLKTNYLSHKS
jgi:hypothetical protein